MYVIKSGILYDVVRGSLKEFESPFAEEFFSEESKSWGHESWKYKQSDGNSERDLVPRNMLWGGRGRRKPPAPVKFLSVCGSSERLYYVLQMSTSCGLFYYDLANGQETRVFHRTEFQPRGLFVDQDYNILTTLENSDGTAHLVQYDPNGKHEKILTSGDCLDENPFLHGTSVYYQSSGLARNEQGLVLATGHASINKLDTISGEIETVLSSERFDYLLPRIASDGTLYSIRVPYKLGPVYPLKIRLMDIILFPWRLCLAIFGFLNMFSLFFAKTPLTTAGGPDPKQIDISKRVIHNRMVNLQETWKKEGKKVAVSKDWKLIKRSGDEDTEIASNVLWFDLDSTGNPVYTDGYSLFDSTGKSKLEADELVSCLSLLRGTVTQATE